MTRVAAIAMLLALGAAGDQRAPAGPAVRLHHLHFRVASIAPALAEAARTHGGTRVILQGLGVGVRVGDYYLLFDDRASSDGPVATPAGEADAVRAAVEWLREHGIAVDVPAGAPPARPIAGDQAFDHVGFAAADPAAVGPRPSPPGWRHTGSSRCGALRIRPSSRLQASTSRSPATPTSRMRCGARCIPTCARLSRGSARSARWTSCPFRRRGSANTGSRSSRSRQPVAVVCGR